MRGPSITVVPYDSKAAILSLGTFSSTITSQQL